jgi:hypothetical protein
VDTYAALYPAASLDAQKTFREEWIMKKSLLVTAVAAAMVLSTASVFAAAADPAPVTIDGSITYQYRNNTNDNGTTPADTSSKKVNKTTTILNFNYDLTSGWDVYARASLQAANGGRDFNTHVYSNDYAAALDQFGFKYTNGNNQVKIGRQAAWIGETGLFYDTTSKVGREIMADGITYIGKTDAWSYTATAVQEDVNYGDATQVSKNKLYAGHVNYNFTNDLLFGATFAAYDFDKKSSNLATTTDPKNFNLWAVNSGYTYGQTTFFAEYGKTNYSTANKAYDFGVAYKFDDKNSLSATYFRVEGNGDINAYTTFDPNAKGMYYSFTHQFNKATSLNFFLDNAKYIDGIDANKNYTSFRTTINYNF